MIYHTPLYYCGAAAVCDLGGDNQPIHTAIPCRADGMSSASSATIERRSNMKLFITGGFQNSLFVAMFWKFLIHASASSGVITGAERF